MLVSLWFFVVVLIAFVSWLSRDMSESAFCVFFPGMKEYPLHEAARAGDLAKLRSLVCSGSPVLETDDVGWTALDYAIQRSQTRCALLLIRSGCFSEHGLRLAIQRDNVTVANALLAAGVHHSGSLTVYQLAVTTQAMRIANELVLSGYPVDAPPKTASPFSHRMHRYFETGKRLAECGARYESLRLTQPKKEHAIFYRDASRWEILQAIQSTYGRRLQLRDAYDECVRTLEEHTEASRLLFT